MPLVDRKGFVPQKVMHLQKDMSDILIWEVVMSLKNTLENKQ